MKPETGFPLELVLTPDGFAPELPGSQHTEKAENLLAWWKEDPLVGPVSPGSAGASRGAVPISTVLIHCGGGVFSCADIPVRAGACAGEGTGGNLGRENGQAAPVGPLCHRRGVREPCIAGKSVPAAERDFFEEISAYTGTVAFYLAEQGQRLRVPERVFFTLWKVGTENFLLRFWPPMPQRERTGGSAICFCNIP